MMNAHHRFAEILAEYTSAMADIAPRELMEYDREGTRDHRILKPADQQRSCMPPRFGGDNRTSR
jgi:hypothetical protein